MPQLNNGSRKKERKLARKRSRAAAWLGLFFQFILLAKNCKGRAECLLQKPGACLLDQNHYNSCSSSCVCPENERVNCILFYAILQQTFFSIISLQELCLKYLLYMDNDVLSPLVRVS